MRPEQSSDSSRRGARAGVTARRRWPRILAWCLAGLLVLHVVGGIGAAWYYSSRIDSDALTVHQPGPWVEDLTVDGADPADGTLTLSPRAGTDASAAMAQLHTPKVYGLHWAGGFARTRGAATGDPSRVTSTVTLAKGD